MAAFAFFLLSLPSRSAYAFTSDGQTYPDDLYGITVQFNATLTEPDNHFAYTWLPIIAHLSNGSTGDTINWFYCEQSNASGHPWYLYTSDLQDLTSAGLGGGRLAYDSVIQGYWGTQGNMPPIITFAPKAAQVAVGQTWLESQFFIKWVVDNSDYRTRYNVSDGSSSLIYPVSWTDAQAYWNPSSRTVQITVPSSNGTAWSCLVWVVQGAGTIVWQYPEELTGASVASTFYGTQSYAMTVTVPSDVSGNLRVRWYYKTSPNGSQSTQTSQYWTIESVPYDPVLSPQTSDPYFIDIKQGYALNGSWSVTAQVALAEHVYLQYLNAGEWVTVAEMSYDPSLQAYWWQNYLPVTGVEYRILVSNSHGQVTQSLGVLIGSTASQKILDIFGNVATYVQNFFTYMSSFFGWLPPEVRSVLIVAILAMITLGLVQLVKP